MLSKNPFSRTLGCPRLPYHVGCAPKHLAFACNEHIELSGVAWSQMCHRPHRSSLVRSGPGTVTRRGVSRTPHKRPASLRWAVMSRLHHGTAASASWSLPKWDILGPSFNPSHGGPRRPWACAYPAELPMVYRSAHLRPAERTAVRGPFKVFQSLVSPSRHVYPAKLTLPLITPDGIRPQSRDFRPAFPSLASGFAWRPGRSLVESRGT